MTDVLETKLAEKGKELNSMEEKYLEQYNSYEKMSQELMQKQQDFNDLEKNMEERIKQERIEAEKNFKLYKTEVDKVKNKEI